MTISDDVMTVLTYPVLSNEVGDLRFVTAQGYAEVSIKCAADSSIVYSASHYPDKQGVCTVFQLGDLIEGWMADRGLSFCSFIFSDNVSQVSATFSVLMCAFINASKDEGYLSVAEGPMISSRINVVPMDGMCRFYFIPKSSSVEDLKMSAYVSGVLCDGSKSSLSVDLTADIKDNKIGCISFSPDSILSMINQDREADSEFAEILSISVHRASSISLSATYYVSDDRDLVGFDFINRFGLIESVWLHSEVLPQIKVESESAVIGHRSVVYDVERSKSFKVEASNITHDQWVTVEHFLASS